MSTKLSENETGISNLVATLILIAVAVIAGAFAYTAFRNQAQSTTVGKHIQVQSLDLTVVPSGSLFSVTMKNSGTESLDNVGIELIGPGGSSVITSSGSWTVGSPPSFSDVEDPALTENVSGTQDITLGSVGGVPEGWIAVETLSDLQDMKNNLDGNYVLMNDIDASPTQSWNGGKGFEPIGGLSGFTGKLDGNGYAIENLYIDRPSEDVVGLFSFTRTNSVVIKNIKLVNPHIRGREEVGALAGSTDHSPIIENCGVESGFVSGGDGGYSVGGLVGDLSGGIISRCYAVTDNVIADTRFGGLVGRFYNGSISNSYARSDHLQLAAKPNASAGGLVGIAYSGTEISRCYSAAITNEGDFSYPLYIYDMGGLVGDPAGGTVSNSFYDETLDYNNDNPVSGSTGKTTGEMQTQSTFTDAGWDFTDVWKMNSYPELQFPGHQYEPTEAGHALWVSTWKDFGEAKTFTSLDADASIPGASDVEVKVEVSDDGSSMKDSIGFTSLKNFPTMDLEDLDDASHARLSVKLYKGSTPIVDSVSLNYLSPSALALGPVSPGQTVSESVTVDVNEGVEYLVRITGYDDEGNEILSKTIRVLSG